MSEQAALGEAAVLLPSAERWKLFLYCSGPLVLLGLAAPFNGLIDIPITFFLKNRLHLTAHGLASFRLWAGIPLYLCFVFGFLRDRWNPFGRGDRGYLVLFGALTAALFTFLAFTKATYATLLIGVCILTSSFMIVQSAWSGLMSTLGQRHVMSGQVSAVLNFAQTAPIVVAFLLGGLLSDRLESLNAQEAAQSLFLTGAAIMVAIAAYGAWGPKSLYAAAPREHAPAGFARDVATLLTHWPIYPVLIILLLWNFSPGGQTVLQYYLSNTLRGTDAQWGEYNAVFLASFTPTYLLYGWLCQRVALSRLLWWGTAIAIPQMIPLIFIHSAAGALWAAIPMGLAGGVATAAYLDLAIRSCPRGLQGTMMMLTISMFWVAQRFGDLWGTDLYDHHSGFAVCVAATTGVYVLILPTLLFVSKRLIATADGATHQEVAASVRPNIG